MEKLLGKEERQIEDKLTEETVGETCKNLASVLKCLPGCGSMNNGDVQNVTIIHTSTVWNRFQSRSKMTKTENSSSETT
jgi:carbon monoxide dehydrogenase subunit G